MNDLYYRYLELENLIMEQSAYILCCTLKGVDMLEVRTEFSLMAEHNRSQNTVMQ